MLQQAKFEGLTINVRHAKILFCGASCAGKSSFSRLLRNEEHEKVYKSTPAADAQQVLLSDKVNVVGTNWISLDSKLETQQITNRLILKLQKQKDIYKAISSSNDTANVTSYFPVSENGYPLNDVPLSTEAISQAAQVDSVNVPYSELQNNISESQSSVPTPDNMLSADKEKPIDNSKSTNQQISIEQQMATYTDGVNASVSGDIPETWDLFTLLDTGGQPEFINMLPAINSSTAITFVVLNISDGKDCLNNLVTAQYKCEGYNYDKCHLKYTNMHLLKCLLSSVKVAALKKDCFHPEIVKQLTNDEHPKPVVCIIGTCADVLKRKFFKKYSKQVFEINMEVKKLIDAIDSDKTLVFWCKDDQDLVIPIDNTISRMPQKDGFKCDMLKRFKESVKLLMNFYKRKLNMKYQFLGLF